MSTRAIRLTFAGSLGHELAARLDLPSAGVRAHALFVHCFTCSKDIVAARQLAATLAALGIAVLRFDFTGLGSSEESFRTRISSNVEDLVLAADHLRTHYRAPAISRPLTAVPPAARRTAFRRQRQSLPSAPSDVAHVLHHFQAHSTISNARCQQTLAGHLSDKSAAGGGCQGPRLRSTSPICARRCSSCTRRRSDRRHRACHGHLHGGEAPQEFRLPIARTICSRTADAAYAAEVLAAWR